MPITTTVPKRVFRFEGTEIPDPAPTAKPEDALKMLAHSYPQFNNATLDRPSHSNGSLVYTIKTEVGVKG